MCMESHDGAPIRALHAGFHKTGSSFLQRQVFPGIPDVSYLGSPSLEKGKPEKHREGSRVVLLSSEAACGYPYPLTKPFSVDTLLENVRLYSIQKVFLFQRELSSWAASLYFQTLNEGRWWAPEEFIRVNREALLTWRDAPEEIESALTEAGVAFRCFSYEGMKQNPQATVDQVTDFLGVARVCVSEDSINKSYYGGRTIWAYRTLNRASALPGFRQVTRALSFSPRRVMQRRRSPLVKWLESSSKLRLDSLDL